MVGGMVRGMLGLLLLCAPAICAAQQANQGSHLGFDRNEYPGDAALATLRQSFSYSSYWLNTPPEARQNTWMGKRTLLKERGFGFLVLFNGRLDAQLKGKNAAALGSADGKTAVAAAVREGFARNTLIFLDQEEGGRLLAEQAAYLFAWVDAVRAAGGRAGVYCSGIDVPDGGSTISTARDVVEREKNRSKGAGQERLKLWIANDQCPPSPGCAMTHAPLSAVAAGELAGSVVVWQYAQSPRRREFTAACPANYAPDGRCYAPGMAHSSNGFIDLNVADSDDPSEGR